MNVTANASQSSNISLYFNGTQIDTVSNVLTASAFAHITAVGPQTIIANANNGSTTVSDTSTFFVSSATTIAPLPNGVVDGINYETGDTSVVLVLYAPLKSRIMVVGDFNNWTQAVNYEMNMTPDSLRFWLRITGLTPGTEYAYQYIIDGSLIVADYNTEKILDKANDPYIPSATYPNLKPFPANATGNIVSVLQTAKPAYNWQVTNFSRPDKRNLIIYELLVRDFVATHNYQTLIDTLSYLKRLGVNTIELMPISEFEGNDSWGYNPDFYFAPDKYYGTETALRQFIDACHLQGMAVVMDLVMNHSFGSSPMVQIYWDGVNNIPAANNPWFNRHPTHAFNVGYQFNHLSQATIDFRNRVITHWLTKYKIDGFRWDLAKGFTQKNTCDSTGNNCNVAAWGNYDTARVATWKNIYNEMQSVSPGSYCILEMFADNSEETVEANYGMLIWGNMNYNFNQATMGYGTNSSWDLSYGVYTNRGYSSPNLITYQESHDEERLMYNNENNGNSSGSYNIKDTATGLARNGMAAAFFAMIPGPKMMWQFGELGYDYSINTCTNLTVDPTGSCRLSDKPIRWDFYNNSNRRALYNEYSQLYKLRNTPNYLGTFTTGAISYNLTNAFKSLIITSDSLSIVVVGNFDVASQPGTVTFPSSGTWYDYLSGTTINATGSAQVITLQPGEYHVYLNKNLNNTVVTALPNVTATTNTLRISIYPNPVTAEPASIAAEVPGNGNAQIDLWNSLGQKIESLYSGFLTKGVHTIPFLQGEKNLQAGCYILRLQQNNKTQSAKFLIQ